jgi:preprotein translocase subunit YajC
MFLQAAGGTASTLMPFFWIAILLVFYFFMIRPQMKRQKEQNAFSTNLEKGQEVVTGSGILGRINKIEGDIVTLEIGSKSFIRIIKSGISKDMTEQLHGKEMKKGPVDSHE